MTAGTNSGVGSSIANGIGSYVTGITTTNSLGSTIVETSTVASSAASNGPGSFVTAVTTTNSLGSTIVATSTEASMPVTGSLASTAPQPTGTPSIGSCPQSNGQEYTADGQTYAISCGTDYLLNDLITPHYSSFTACLKACSDYVPIQAIADGKPCVAVAFGQTNPGGNCYLKYAISVVNAGNSGIIVGRNIDYSIPQSAVSESLIQSYPSTTSGAPGGSTSSAASSPTASGNPCSGASGQTGGQLTSSNAQTYSVSCQVLFDSATLTLKDASTLQRCVSICDHHSGCVAVSFANQYTSNNCYLISAISGITYGDSDFDSAYQSNYTIGPDVTSTTLSGSASTTDISTPPTVPIVGATSSSSDSAVSSPAAATSSPASSSPTSSPAATSSPASASSAATTIPKTSNPPSSPTAATSPPSSPPAALSSTSPAPYSVPGGPNEPTATKEPDCNANPAYGDGYQYSDRFATAYNIRCNLDVVGTNGDTAAHADTFTGCLEYCSLLENCVAATFEFGNNATNNNANCYIYYDFQSYSNTAPPNLFSGVAVQGPSTGAVEPGDLCGAQSGDVSDGVYGPDTFGNCYDIGCGGQSITPPAAGTLYPTVMTSLEACLTYCSIYKTCVGVNWLGHHTQGDLGMANCVPLAATGAVVSGGAAESAFAELTSCRGTV